MNKSASVYMCHRQCEVFACVCICGQVVCLNIQTKAIEGNFTAAHFQAFVFLPVATSHTRAPAVTNFLSLSLSLLSPSIYVCKCVCMHACAPQVSLFTTDPLTDPRCKAESDTISSEISYSDSHACGSLCHLATLLLSLFPLLFLFNGYHSSFSSFIITCVSFGVFHSPPAFPSLSCCL